ncbi:MAG: ThuA domain-containing protein [Planctomycetaceae bacterium]|jgi:type 1 glutamine amidotransferase|nr:ThuA domain-containing protein [Planctomycetaceae bacterium]
MDTKRSWNLFFASLISLTLIGGIAYAQTKSENSKLNEPEYKLQLRSRSQKPETKYTDYSIFYKTKHWKVDETAFVKLYTTEYETTTSSQRDNKYRDKISEIRQFIKEQGVFNNNFFNKKTYQDVLENENVKNVIVVPETRDFQPLDVQTLMDCISVIQKSGKNVAVVRDLIYAKHNEFTQREQVVRKIEETCPTISTCDLLHKPAFRFEEDKRSHVTYLVSDDHFHAEKILPVFSEYVDDHYGTYSTILHGEHTDTFANLAELQTTDVFVVFVRRLALPKEQLQQIKDYVNSAQGGVLGIRTASHAFSVNGKVPEGHANWAEFDHEVLGGNYHGHGKDELGGNVANVESFTDSPLLKEVKPEKWHSNGWVYWTSPLQDKDAVVYQTVSTSEGEAPLTWTRFYKGKRVAYTAIGHHDDFRVEQARQMIVNLILWTAGKK